MIQHKSDIALIYPPFGAEDKPALGLSLIKSALVREGFRTDLFYVNLILAEKLGTPFYYLISEAIPHFVLVGEWLFAPALFGDNTDADTRYIQEVLWGPYRSLFPPAFVHELLRVREMLPGFLDAWVESIDWSPYRWVGFSSSFHQHCASLALARRIKQNHPDIQILFGGSNCFGTMGTRLPRLFPCVDYVCIGEGDIAVPMLIRSVTENDPVLHIPGIVSRREVRCTEAGFDLPLVTDPDSLPYPDFSDYLAQLQEVRSSHPFDPMMLMELSRGCWWGEKKRCTFCGLNANGLSFRSKSPRRALDEFHYITSTYGTNVCFVDNVLDEHYFSTLIPDLSEIPGVSFFVDVRAGLRQEHLSLLANAGCTQIVIGIESFRDEILRLIGKGTTAIQNIQVLKWAKQYGIRAGYNLLWGFPGEEPDAYRRMEELIPQIVHLDPPGNSLHVRFDRFGVYLQDPEKYGITGIKPLKSYYYIYHGLSERDLFDIAYSFSVEYPDDSECYTRNLRKILKEWEGRSEAVLDLFQDDRGITLVDTRVRQARKEYLFEGLAAEVYLFCDTAQSVQHLQDHFQTDISDITDILNRFVMNGLMVQSGNTYLSLAIIRSRPDTEPSQSSE